MSTTSAPVKRACDSCHRRKVKCIGEGNKPCKNCISAGLNCTYNAIPQKKGPKGSRAKVLSELRETQRQSQLASHYGGFHERSYSPALSKTPGLVSEELVNSSVEFFFAHLYPSVPILHRQRVQEAMILMEHSVEAYCMITSLCAYMMLQSNMRLPPGVGHHDTGQISSASTGLMLLDETVRVRKGYDYIENPTIYSVITSFFLFGCHFCLDKQNSAWFHLREATTHAIMMGMHDEETYKLGDATDNSRKRRLFWLLFVTERSYALHKHRPLTLHATINLPSIDEDPAEAVQLSGFLHLVSLYKPFDNTFIGLWNKVRSGCLPSWLAQLQTQLLDALPAYLESTEAQAVDLRTSQQWLRTMVWQLSISHGFISSMATDNTMSFKYPIEISRDLLALSSQFSQQAMEVHGVGLIEKIFDVACTLTDVMACVPLEPSTFELGPRDYLHSFLNLLSTLRAGQSRFLPLLVAKIHEVLPGISLPLPTSLLPPTSAGAAATSSPYGTALTSRITDSLDRSSSTPTSHEASPYDSPPHLAMGGHHAAGPSQYADPASVAGSHYVASYPSSLAYSESADEMEGYGGYGSGSAHGHGRQRQRQRHHSHHHHGHSGGYVGC